MLLHIKIKYLLFCAQFSYISRITGELDYKYGSLKVILGFKLSECCN